MFLVMVSPKKIASNDGDKSPSPEPFKEPEGMVTIDLNASGSSKNGEGKNTVTRV